MQRLPLSSASLRRSVMVAMIATVSTTACVPDGVVRWLGAPSQALAEEPAVPAGGAAKEAADEEDPFADELNPFGTGKPVKKPVVPAPAAAMPPGKPGPDRQAEPADGSGPEPKQAPRPKSRPKLPVPFPEAPAEDDLAPRRDKMRGRLDRPSQPGGRAPRADGDDAWIEQDETEKLLVKAEQFEKEGKLEEARDLLREAIDKDPSLVVGHLALGVVLRRLGDFRGSVDACTKGIAIDPQEPELYLRRGIAWFHQGLYGIALEDFEEAAGLAYEDPRPELWRGLTLVELDRPLEAINAYASAIRRDRSCVLAYLNRGLTYLATNQPRKAEFDFNQAIRQQPKDARGWFNRGVAQARQGRFDEAIVSYETVLDIDPKHEGARRNLEAARSMATRTTAGTSR